MYVQETAGSKAGIKNGFINGCVAGSTWGIHRSSVSSACLGCFVGGTTSGLYEWYVAERALHAHVLARVVRTGVGVSSVALPFPELGVFTVVSHVVLANVGGVQLSVCDGAAGARS